VDSNGVTVPMGVPGEVLFRGYNVMPGYWNDEEMTKKAIVEDGWLKSGYLKTTVDTVTVASTPTKTKPRPVSGVFAQGHSDDERGRLRGGDRQDQRHHHPGRREHTAAGDRVFSGVPSRNRAGSGSYANGTRSADFPRVPVTAVKRKRYRTCFAAARGVAVVTE